MSSAKQTNRLFFGGFVLVLFVLALYIFKSFLLTISVGALLALATSNLRGWFWRVFGGRNLIASLATTLAVCAVFVVPVIYLASAAVSAAANIDIIAITQIIERIKAINMPSALAFIEPQAREFLDGFNVAALAQNAIEYARLSVEKSASFVVQTALVMVFLFFAHFYGAPLSAYIKRVSPVAASEVDAVFGEVANTMSVVFYSTLANMVLQGALFSVIAAIYGFNALFFGVLFAFSSLIPAVGGLLVYGSVSAYLLSVGDAAGAGVVFIYSFVVISGLADSVIKPIVIKIINERLLHTPARINELIIFFSMVAGLSSFGFWGLVLGPAVSTLLVAALRVYAMVENAA